MSLPIRKRILPPNYLKVVSLFDGISCLRVALEREGFNFDYYASEIDKHAIVVSDRHGYSTRLGDVRNVGYIPNVDLLCGGSPCTDLSIAKKDRKGLEGEHSSLFWEYLRVLRLIKPKWFILENVYSMSKADRDIITREMGVEPIMINAALVSAQCRKRLFWTNIPVVSLPIDRGIKVKDILEPDAEVDERMVDKNGKAHCLDANYYKGSSVAHSIEKSVRTQVIRGLIQVGHIGNSDRQVNRVYDASGKAPTLLAGSNCGGPNPIKVSMDSHIRKLTPLECERLQSLPDGYTEGISNTQRYRCLGNGFNAEVIRFILSFIPKTDSSSHK